MNERAEPVPGGLTPEQSAVVAEAADARLLVSSGPGTGKTHVLTRRIVTLIARDDLAPGTELLILTFSRAAVGELRRRVRQLGGRASWTRAFTFDSFATRILSDADPDGSWISAGYDGRIKAATELLRSDEEAAARLGDVRHVLIDELQDVVGVRADFVLAVLECVRGGFTLFGDPAQGIYNFQLDGAERRAGASRLYGRLRARFHETISEQALGTNFRGRAPGATVASWAGSELNAARPDYASIQRRLRTCLLSLPVAPPPSLLPRMPGTVGILGPWNAHSLLTSRQLWQAGVPHQVRRSATDRVAPAWVARLLREARGVRLGRPALNALLAASGVVDIDADRAWSMLHRIDRRPPRSPVDLEEVVHRIRTGDLPDDLSAREDAQIVVSTIHRAKGLEYDYVLITESPDRAWDDVEVGEEARLLYVAMTRARRELLQQMPLGAERVATVADRGESRTVRRGYRRAHLRGFEIRPDDAEREEPALDDAGGRSASELQDYISSSVEPGDELAVELADAARGRYALCHKGVPVGRLSEQFSAALSGQLWGKFPNWPEEVTEVRVEGIDTVSGEAAAGTNAGLSGPPLWLRVRPLGLGELRFARRAAK